MILGHGSTEMCSLFMQFAIAYGRANITMAADGNGGGKISTSSCNEAERLDKGLFEAFKWAWHKRGESIPAARTTGAWPNVD